jgi:hypothetical protein
MIIIFNDVSSSLLYIIIHSIAITVLYCTVLYHFCWIRNWRPKKKKGRKKKNSARVQYSNTVNLIHVQVQMQMQMQMQMPMPMQMQMQMQYIYKTNK